MLINPSECQIATEVERLILEDIAKVVYAPVSAFKKIIENPKYMAAIIILLLFIGLQMGYAYTQFSKTYTESTSPAIGQLSAYTNATASIVFFFFFFFFLQLLHCL